VIRLAGIGGDTIAVVDDCTAQLAVWCPAGTSPWEPSSHGRFEFEVTMEGASDSAPDLDTGYGEITKAALAGRLEDAQAAATAFFGRLERDEPAAVATDIRPLD